LWLSAARQVLPLSVSTRGAEAAEMGKFLFILMLFGCWRTSLASPLEAYRLQEVMAGSPLGLFVEYLIDHEASYDEATINSAPASDWKRLDVPYRNLGHIHAPVWIRFLMLNGTEHARTIYLENNYSLTDRITLLGEEAKSSQSQTLGDMVPEASRQVRYRNPIFVLSIEPGLHRFLAKIDTRELVTLAFKVWDPSSFNTMMYQESLLIGLLFGITVALLFYNVILYFSTGLALLKPYCFYVLFFILTEFCLIGASQLIVTDPMLSRWLANTGFRLFLTLGILSALAFMRLFLNLKAFRPGLDKITQGLMLILFLLGLYVLADGPEGSIVSSLALFASSLHFTFCTLVIVRDGYRPARILLLAWTLIIAGSGVAGLADLGVIDVDMGLTLVWHFAAGCLEMILLSLAIGEWWREERLRRRLEAQRAEAIRIAIQSRQDHAFGQLKKIIYPHQLEQIMDGQQLEDTMPVGKGQAAVIAFDVVASSQAEHDTIQEFLRHFFACCHESMMKNYQPLTLEANAYRIKETGDGFLCSIGYPFKTRESRSVADVAVNLAQEFARLFYQELRAFPALQHLTCCSGIALDRVESFFPKQGVQVYDLYGRAIVLATRYEALRKEIKDFTPDSSYIIIQERVFQKLSEPYKVAFEQVNLAARGIRVRDDAEATVCYGQRITCSQRDVA
jgi:hypothetical protein